MKLSNNRTVANSAETGIAGSAPTYSVIDGIPDNSGESEQDISNVRPETMGKDAPGHVIKMLGESSCLREPLLQEYSS